MEFVTSYQSYREYKTELDTELKKSAEGFVRIGYLLKVARDTDILRESGYENVNDFAKAEYGIDKTLVSRFISINDRFSEGGNSPQLKEQYRGFGYAKLTIMLQLPDEVNEEITQSFSKSEIQSIKEEFDEEKKKTDIEILLEGQATDASNLTEVIRQLGHDQPELYLSLYEAKERESLQEVLAPAGESIYSVRLQGIGRLLLSVKGTDQEIALINIRTNEKETYSWEALRTAIIQVMSPAGSGKESWENVYGEEYPIREEPKQEVAPVQPEKPKQKKQSKVTKSPIKLENTKWEAEFETGEEKESPEADAKMPTKPENTKWEVESADNEREISEEESKMPIKPENTKWETESADNDEREIPETDPETTGSCGQQDTGEDGMELQQPAAITKEQYFRAYQEEIEMISAHISNAQCKIGKKALYQGVHHLELAVKHLRNLIDLKDQYGDKYDEEEDENHD